MIKSLDMNDKILIYTDGSSRGNPGPGGWGAILCYNGTEKELYGGELATTNNRMELTAAIESLAALQRPCQVHLTTDSQYVRKGITEWLPQWLKRNWRTASKQPVKNKDLWQRLHTETLKHQIEWHWVKAHNGHVYNERVDALAKLGIETIKVKDK